jgi:hypothetical protein
LICALDLSVLLSLNKMSKGGAVRSISVTDGVHDRIALLARAWGYSDGEVVRRLLDEFSAPTRHLDSGDLPDESGGHGVPVHAVYEGNRIEGVFYPGTRRLDITAGVLAGRSFKSPSGAAIAVVQAHNPEVHPNRNGWSFWVVTESGKWLQTIRR